MPLILLLAALTAGAAPPPFANPPEIVSAGGVLNGLRQDRRRYGAV